MQLLRTSPPNADESFMGYILRVAELNAYERLSWILKLGGLEAASAKIHEAALKSHKELRLLAYVMRRSIKELIPLTYSPIKTGTIGLHLFNGSPAHKTTLRLANPKLCPNCLCESAYCRRVWDLRLVTVCLKHKRLLIDTCPKCHQPISWARKKICTCPCGYDWRQSPPLPVTDAELKLTSLLHWLCGAGTEIEPPTIPNRSNRVFGLDLRGFISVIEFIAKQYKDITITNKSHGLGNKNQSLHQVYTKACATLENWPHNYFTFLEWRQAWNRHAFPSDPRSKIRTTKDFGGFYTGLQTTLAGKQFDFMRMAFRRYLQNHPRNTYRPDISEYMPRGEAMKRLAVSWRYLTHLVEVGHLKERVAKHKKKTVYLVEVASFKKLEMDFSISISTYEAASQLGVCERTVIELLNNGCLKAIHRSHEPSGLGWRVCPQSVEELLSQIRSRISSERKFYVENIRSFSSAMRKLSRGGIRVGQVVRDIVDGKIVPCGEGNHRIGIHSFIFEKAAMGAYVKTILKSHRKYEYSQEHQLDK